MIDMFVSKICDILQIPTPTVSFDTSDFPTETMLGRCSPDGSTIFLKERDGFDPDQCFAAAHELRHVWQKRHPEESLLSGYVPVESGGSAEEYNLQPAEVDANAFASLIMISFFRVEPQFKGLSEAVKARIEARRDEIAAELSNRP